MTADEKQGPTYAERPNKTAIKRELAARGALIEQATGLSDAELGRLGLGDEEIAEIARVRAIRPSGARNRQLKFCVKRLADVDLGALDTYLNNRHSQRLEINQAFHRLEQWRDRLLAQGDALMGEAIAEWPGLDRQQLRQLVRDARHEVERGKPVGAKRKLFKYLRLLAEKNN